MLQLLDERVRLHASKPAVNRGRDRHLYAHLPHKKHKGSPLLTESGNIAAPQVAASLKYVNGRTMHIDTHTRRDRAPTSRVVEASEWGEARGVREAHTHTHAHAHTCTRAS